MSTDALASVKQEAQTYAQQVGLQSGQLVAIGATIGSAIPGVGTAIGAAVGAVLTVVGVRGSTVRMSWEKANALAVPISTAIQTAINAVATPEQKKLLNDQAAYAVATWMAGQGHWWGERKAWNNEQGRTLARQLTEEINPANRFNYAIWYLFVWIGQNTPEDGTLYREHAAQIYTEVLAPQFKRIQVEVPPPVIADPNAPQPQQPKQPSAAAVQGFGWLTAAGIVGLLWWKAGK